MSLLKTTFSEPEGTKSFQLSMISFKFVFICLILHLQYLTCLSETKSKQCLNRKGIDLTIRQTFQGLDLSTQ